MKWAVPAPGEEEAQRRSWEVARAAWRERGPVARRRPVGRGAVVALAAALALAAAAVSAAGTGVFGSLRDALTREPNAKPALFALPAPGRLLVESSRGTWVVARDGSRRLLGGYRDASWSPRGLYLAAIHGHELRALEADGTVHWSLARPGRLAFPRWSDETPPCCRVAYLARNALRVVNGDGTGDRLLAARVRRVAPAWHPRTHALAYVDANGDIRVVAADANAFLLTFRPSAPPVALEWSADGRFLLVRSAHGLELFGTHGERLVALGPGAAPVTSAAFSPDGRSVAFVQRVSTASGTRSILWLYARLRPDATRTNRVFGGAGDFRGIAWSPDGRWLLVDWTSADQWLFIRAAPVSRVRAVANIRTSFGPNASVGTWCCP